MFVYWVYTLHLLLVAIALCAGFAAWKGALPERWAASANLIAAILDLINSKVLPASGYATGTLVVDLLLAVTFLVLALRYGSLFLGAAMLLQAAQFSLHAFYFVTARPADFLWATVNNSVSWGVVWVITAAVVVSWRRRGMAQRADAQAQPAT